MSMTQNNRLRISTAQTPAWHRKVSGTARKKARYTLPLLVSIDNWSFPPQLQKRRIPSPPEIQGNPARF